MDKENTRIGMSLFDYERLKECQKSYIDLVREIKSMLKPTNIEENSVEITIDKEKLEKFLFNFAPDDLKHEHLDHTHVSFLYKKVTRGRGY
ncbi:MAG: hypothetical protein ABFC94_17345 [Syntrophomonas sp.]